MNEIFFDISITAIVSALFKMIIPGKKNGNQVKMIISCFFILTVINSVKGNITFAGIRDILDTEITVNNYSDVLTEKTADEIANALREKIKAELEKENIEFEKIYIDINISENSSISINEIRLVFKDIATEDAKRAVVITEKCTGDEIKVSLEEIS